MFENTTLKNHFQNSPTIQSRAKIIAEWNMNMPDNIFKLGNYRYRPQSSDTRYLTIQSTFDQNDVGGFYTGATDADIVVDGGVDNEETPIRYTATRQKYNLYYSLEDCIKPFRPRSGINKCLYIPGRYLQNFNTDALDNQGISFTQRPRYYMPTRNDEFRYWTSYRTEKESSSSANTTERGVANRQVGNLFYIDDAAPFVVYKTVVPANRLVLKMQTNVGTSNLGPYSGTNGSFQDPFYGDSNKTVPKIWKIQVLKGNQWVTVQDINLTSTRPDGSAIIKEDGYVELSYGLKIPDAFKNRFIHAEVISSINLLPLKSIDGYAYLLVSSNSDKGIYYIWNETTDQYDTFVPEYSWFLADESLDQTKHFVTDLIPSVNTGLMNIFGPVVSSNNETTSGEVKYQTFIEPATNERVYREFSFIRGIRIVIDTMNKFGSTFDLIEFSPRLLVDISNQTLNYNITKSLGDLGSNALPIGQLLASNGSMTVFDEDQVFNENNINSIISKFVRKNIKFTFYENIMNVNGFDYLIPIKTLYSEGFPQADITGGTISIELRDFYFHFESMPAPQLFITNVSLSYAIGLLLDYVGFTNYIYKRIPNEIEPVIPYFFVGPDRNLAEVLNDLAVSTQTAMFFDEYNNFVLMSKNYLMPTNTSNLTISATQTSRLTPTYELVGSEVLSPVSEIVISTDDGQGPTRTEDEVLDAGFYDTESWTVNLGNGSPTLIENTAQVIQNKLIPGKKLANIIAIASKDKKIYNDGKITYSSKYIEKGYRGLNNESDYTSKENIRWIYKPSLLWQVADRQELKEQSKSDGYTLSAVVLNSDLSNVPPTVVNGQIINNVIDIGESAYLISRKQGYFYANGEIIKYDALEYNVDGIGNVWISDELEYDYYFNKLPYNGKIYSTGRVRIFSEPEYDNAGIKNGPVAKHGRSQFGTPITSHPSGLSSHWTNINNRRGCEMQSQYLFGSQTFSGTLVAGAAGIKNDLAKKSTINGIVKRYLSQSELTETEVLKIDKIDPSKNKGVVQSSALVLKGPNFGADDPKQINFISYVYKPTEDRFKHFGTRMRIIGANAGQQKDESGQIIVNTVLLDGTTYYQSDTTSPNQGTNVSGNSGGIAVLLNSETNNGYYFEIISLDGGSDKEPNLIFYKIKKDNANTNAIPEVLWTGYSNIISDSGNFVGLSRKFAEEFPSVYDLAVEYIDNINNTNDRRFFLYINNVLVATIDDTSPLPKYNNIALFTRGSSKCMFENVYAITENYSQNTGSFLTEPMGSIFGGDKVNSNQALRKYALSGIFQQTYLSGISSNELPKFNLYYDEFGTIMRECAYFNIRFDNAYPALSAKIIQTPDKVKEYVVSGFEANAYGAEFLVFNSTDTLMAIGTNSYNFLNILGIAFTQDSSNTLSVDDYFKKKSSFSDPELKGDGTIINPLFQKIIYDQIKISRMTYGKNEFAIQSDYIQNQDMAEDLMGWVINKLMVPKKSVGIKLFSTPILQLGDIVSIDYKNSDGIDLIASEDARFLIYNIEYERSNSGPDMTVYLSEV